MHKLTRVKDAARTRFVELLNLETGTIDYCFDEADLTFGFMEIGKTYDCKIALLGDFVNKPKLRGAIEVQLVNPDVFIGNFAMMEIRIGEDTYHISKKDGEGIDLSGQLFYSFSRKDLMQVDHVIHPDCL